MSHPNCNHAKLEQIIFFEPYSKIGTWQSSSPYFPWAEPESSLPRSSDHLIWAHSKSICDFHPPEFRWSWSLYFFGLHFLYGNMTTKNFSLSWEETSDHGPIEDTWNCLQVSLCPFYLMKSSPLMLGLLVLSQVLIFLVTSLMFFNFFRTVGLLFLALLLFLIAVVLFTSFFLFLATKQCFG